VRRPIWLGILVRARASFQSHDAPLGATAAATAAAAAVTAATTAAATAADRPTSHRGIAGPPGPATGGQPVPPPLATAAASRTGPRLGVCIPIDGAGLCIPTVGGCVAVAWGRAGRHAATAAAGTTTTTTTTTTATAAGTTGPPVPPVRHPGRLARHPLLVPPLRYPCRLARH